MESPLFDRPAFLFRCLSCLLLAIAGVLAPGGRGASADEHPGKSLRFDREFISRYSLDHLPRSLSIRQGADIWLGYDLERAKLYKAWRAPADGPGLKGGGFVTRSMGKSLFEDKSDETWQLRRGAEIVPLKVRYLGCSDRQTYFELRWELRHDAAKFTLVERVSIATPTPAGSPRRELRVDALRKGEVLLPPSHAREAWQIGSAGASTLKGSTQFELASSEWHQVTLR